MAKPTKGDYAAVVTDINATKLVGEATVFEREPHVPITHLAYFKPNKDAFLVELKSKDRRSAKEWEYINGAGTWVETGLSALSVCKESAKDLDEVSRYLSLAEKSFQAALQVLAMRAQYFRDVVGHGLGEARQMAFLVEQGHDAVHSSSYRTTRENLTGRLETEAAKQLEKLRLEKDTNKKKKGGGAGGAAGDD